MRPVALLEVDVVPPRESDWLAPGERARLAAMRFPRRRHDFRQGRWTAKRALARALGGATERRGALSGIEIRPGERGAPEALRNGRPLPLDLSLSHRAGAALCVVGERGSVVGCDLEWTEPRSEAFERCFLADTERAWLEGRPAGERARAANLIWSAKESALKALRVGLDVDTRAVPVFVSDGGERRFRVRVPGFGPPLEGRWGTHGPWIWTIASPRARLLSELFRVAVGHPTRRGGDVP